MIDIQDKSFTEIEEYIIHLENKIEELQNIIEQYEENNDAYREKLSESSGPF